MDLTKSAYTVLGTFKVSDLGTLSNRDTETLATPLTKKIFAKLKTFEV